MPVFWVGLPAQRGSRATTDSAYLNELYRSRAEKAGHHLRRRVGRLRRRRRPVHAAGAGFRRPDPPLASGDGVYFTKAGARKLAHYVEREIQRSIANRAVPVALPAPEPAPADAGRAPAAERSGARVRSPARWCRSRLSTGGGDELLGGGGRRAAAAPGHDRSGRDPRAHQGRADRGADRPRRRFHLAAQQRADRASAASRRPRPPRAARTGGTAGCDTAHSGARNDRPQRETPKPRRAAGAWRTNPRLPAPAPPRRVRRARSSPIAAARRGVSTAARQK